jgi:RimJ/RimL family protein N-acetyltransferase
MLTPLPVQTARFLLRLPEEQDAVLIETFAGDPAVAATVPTIPHPYPPGGAEHWVARAREAARRDERYPLVIARREDDTLVGVITLHLNHRARNAEVGYWIGPPHWHQGIATEAVRAITSFAFGALHLHRVWATALARNPASHRVLEKTGFRLEGRLREHMVMGNELEDVFLYGLLSRDVCKAP